MATVAHFGPYHELHKAHTAIRQWLKDNRYTAAGPNWEVYGHWTDECDKDPSKIRTDVYYLLVS